MRERGHNKQRQYRNNPSKNRYNDSRSKKVMTNRSTESTWDTDYRNRSQQTKGKRSQRSRGYTNDRNYNFGKAIRKSKREAKQEYTQGYMDEMCKQSERETKFRQQQRNTMYNYNKQCKGTKPQPKTRTNRRRVIDRNPITYTEGEHRQYK